MPRHSEAQPEGWAYNRVSTVNAYVRGDDISRYIRARAKARTQSKRPVIPEVGVPSSLKFFYTRLQPVFLFFYTAIGCKIN